MKEILNKNRVIFVITMVLLVVVTGLYATYAINVYMEETTPLTYDKAFNFSLTESLEQQVSVPAGKTKVFDLEVLNPYEGSVKYGVAYELVSPTTLPSNVTIAQSSESSSPSVGLAEASSSNHVSIIVKNDSTSNLTLTLSIAKGYENGGDVVLEAGKVLIEEVYEVVPPPAVMTLKNLGLEDDLKTDTPDFKKTSCSSGCDETTIGIYVAEDDLGTSYYFRGDVENNYVYFANSYWRIIRINGDGTVRMIYDGTSAHANGESSTDRRITTSAFNINFRDNAFVGYMNGTTDGTNFSNGTTISESYLEAHSNNYDSTIKAYLEDTWYPTISASDKEKIADAIYCNDRSFDTRDMSYTGIGRTMTGYGAYQRLDQQNSTTFGPSLTCANPNDRFTLESSNFKIETNGKLESPVGLITADEVIFAGGTATTSNPKHYLYTGNAYWTLSPYFVNSSGEARVFYFGVTDIAFLIGNINSNHGVRPVISLKSDALQYSATSNGTMQYPFILK